MTYYNKKDEIKKSLQLRLKVNNILQTIADRKNTGLDPNDDETVNEKIERIFNNEDKVEEQFNDYALLIFKNAGDFTYFKRNFPKELKPYFYLVYRDLQQIFMNTIPDPNIVIQIMTQPGF